MLRAMILSAVFVIGLSCERAHAGFLNGSFEAVDVPDGSFTIYAQGSNAITGWTVIGAGPDSVAVADGGFVQSGITFQAQDGKQWIDLAGYQSNAQTSGITQSVATDIGSTYAVSFWVGSATDGALFFPTSVDVSINGGARTRFTNPNAPSNKLDWMQFTMTFTATSSSTSVAFYNGGTPSNYLSGFDNAQIEKISAAVPEPATLTMLGVGVSLIGLSRRRRRSAT